MKKAATLTLTIMLCITISYVNGQDSSRILAYNAYSKKNWATAESYFHQYLKTNATDTFAIYSLAMTKLTRYLKKQVSKLFPST